MTKWIIGIILIILIAAAAWWWGTRPAQAPALPAQSNTQGAQTSSGLPTAQSDTSDAAVVQDTAAIDSQMGGLNSDSAAVDSSMNDQPVTQSY